MLEAVSDWKRYYQALEGREPRPFFLEALSFVATLEETPKAIDLGCGDGTETIYLLKQGWQVTAIDQEASAIQTLLKKLEPSLRSNLSMQVSSFDKAKLPSADLIYAGLSLPFCSANVFKQVWQNIKQALPTGAYFAGHFLGTEDTWAKNPAMTFMTKHDIEMLMHDFDILLFRELKEDAPTALEQAKHWHYFEMVAVKK